MPLQKTAIDIDGTEAVSKVLLTLDRKSVV